MLTLEDMLRAEDEVAREIRELSTPSDPSGPPYQHEKFSLSFGKVMSICITAVSEFEWEVYRYDARQVARLLMDHPRSRQIKG